MLKYEKFKEAILDVIQSSGLDVGVVYFILKDITGQIQALYMQQLQKEANKEQKEEETEENAVK